MQPRNWALRSIVSRLQRIHWRTKNWHTPTAASVEWAFAHNWSLRFGDDFGTIVRPSGCDALTSARGEREAPSRAQGITAIERGFPPGALHVLIVADFSSVPC